MHWRSWTKGRRSSSSRCLSRNFFCIFGFGNFIVRVCATSYGSVNKSDLFAIWCDLSQPKFDLVFDSSNFCISLSATHQFDLCKVPLIICAPGHSSSQFVSNTSFSSDEFPSPSALVLQSRYAMSFNCYRESSVPYEGGIKSSTSGILNRIFVFPQLPAFAIRSERFHSYVASRESARHISIKQTFVFCARTTAHDAPQCVVCIILNQTS